MVNHLDILFADEPCANPGSENSTLVLDLFKEMNEEMHQTIVMVSHEDWHKKISTGSSTCATGVSIRRGSSKEKQGRPGRGQTLCSSGVHVPEGIPCRIR
jgi:putative ABC transport system ATP-binding protein